MGLGVDPSYMNAFVHADYSCFALIYVSRYALGRAMFLHINIMITIPSQCGKLYTDFSIQRILFPSEVPLDTHR